MDMRDKNSLEFRKTILTYNEIAHGISEHIHPDFQYAMNFALDRLQEKALNRYLKGEDQWQITEDDIKKEPALSKPLKFKGESEFVKRRSKENVINKLMQRPDENLLNKPLSFYDIYNRFEMKDVNLYFIIDVISN
jgi:hypothetical protein